MGLLTGTAFLGILSLWPGVWPGRYLPAAWLLAGLVILFWVGPALLVGMRAQYFAGMIATILTGLTLFFVGGGLGLVRANWEAVPWFSRLFPNVYAVDPCATWSCSIPGRWIGPRRCSSWPALRRLAWRPVGRWPGGSCGGWLDP